MRETAVNECDAERAVIGTSLGNVRGENQDRAAIVRYSSMQPEASFVLAALCDGLGGMQDGGRCAQLGLTEIILSLIGSRDHNSRSRFRRAVEAANIAIYTRYHERGGTTFSGFLLPGSGSAIGINVGDSRIYELSKGHLRQLSIDDTIAGQIQHLKGLKSTDIDHGHISQNLAQYLGLGPGLEPHFVEIALPSPDLLYLITSDGAHRPAGDTFSDLATHAPTSAELVRRFLQLSRWTGGLDNATIIALEMSHHEASPSGGDSIRSSSDAPLLEIWDSFSKMELFITEFRDSIQTSRNRGAESKRQLKPSEQRVIPEKDRRRRKNPAKKEWVAKARTDSRGRDLEQPELEIEVLNGDNQDTQQN
jgi:PPM family protein phosphatase